MQSRLSERDASDTGLRVASCAAGSDVERALAHELVRTLNIPGDGKKTLRLEFKLDKVGGQPCPSARRGRSKPMNAQYRIKSPTIALERDGSGRMHFLTVPVGGIVQPIGDVQQIGLIDVLYELRLVSMFLRDIEDRGEIFADSGTTSTVQLDTLAVERESSQPASINDPLFPR